MTGVNSLRWLMLVELPVVHHRTSGPILLLNQLEYRQAPLIGMIYYLNHYDLIDSLAIPGTER